MNTPQPYRMLNVGASNGRGFPKDYHNCTWSRERGFFEPITNVSFEEMGLRVLGWTYEPVALWPGAKVRHRKRDSFYDVIKIFNTDRPDMEAAPDGEFITTPGVVSDLSGAVRAQVSTRNHSFEWAVYRNAEGMLFARPLSEFTNDRFEILYNGA